MPYPRFYHVANMSFNASRESKVLAKIFEFKVSMGYSVWSTLRLKVSTYTTNCILYGKDSNKPGCFVKCIQIGPRLEDMAVERFNNGHLGTSHETGCEQ